MTRDDNITITLNVAVDIEVDDHGMPGHFTFADTEDDIMQQIRNQVEWQLRHLADMGGYGVPVEPDPMDIAKDRRPE